MSLWMKNGNLIMNSQGNLVDCATCPCGSGPGPGPGPGWDEWDVVGPDIKKKRFAQIVDVDLPYHAHNTEIWPTRPNNQQYDRHHVFADDWDETSDKVVSTIFTPSCDKFYCDKTLQTKMMFYYTPMSGGLITIPAVKEYTKLYEDRVLSGSGTAYISSYNQNNINLTVYIPPDIQEYDYLTSIVVNNANNDVLNESSLSTTFALFELSSRAFFEGWSSDQYYTRKISNYDTHIYKAKIKLLRDIYVRKVISGINYAYCIDTVNPNNMDDALLYYRMRRYTTGYCGAIARFDLAENGYYYFYNNGNRYYTAYYDRFNDTFKYRWDMGYESTNVDCPTEFREVTNRNNITSCLINVDTDNWEYAHPNYTNLKFDFQGETYYIYKMPAYLATDGIWRSNSSDYTKCKDNVKITGSDWDNLVILSSDTQKQLSTGWLITTVDEGIHKLSCNTNTGVWAFYNGDTKITLTGGTIQQPPPYYFDREYQTYCYTFSGHYIAEDTKLSTSVVLIKESYYDYQDGNWIQDIFYRCGSTNSDMKTRLNRGLAKVLNPFINVTVSGTSLGGTGDTDTRTLGTLMSQTNPAKDNNPSVFKLCKLNDYMDHNVFGDHGWVRRYGANFGVGLMTLSKMTPSQITTCVNENNTLLEKTMSASLETLSGIYCEIDQFFNVQTTEDSNAVSFRVRLNWRQVLAFDTIYQFGITVPTFSGLTKYSSYDNYNLISPFVNINSSNATAKKFHNTFAVMNSWVLIRPISGVTELTNDDGHDKWVHQDNWFPTQ